MIKNIHSISSNPRERIKKAFSLYDRIAGSKNHFALNSALKLSSDCAPHKILSIWDDIQSSNNFESISQGLVVKCCSNALRSKTRSIADSQRIADILEFVLEHQRTLKDDIYIFCALITAQGASSNIDGALRSFNAIAADRVNVECVGAIMTALILNGQNEEALSMHRRFEVINNDVTHLLALKAAKNSGDFQFGLQLIEKHVDFRNEHSVELMNSMIDFFGEFGDVEAAQNVFGAVPDGVANAVTLNVMMTCFLNHHDTDKALELYSAMSRLHDDVSHLLALKSCIESKDEQFGREVIASMNRHRDHRPSNELVTTLIDFHGEFGDVEAAQSVFDGIPRAQRSVECIGAMMKCNINNGRSLRALALYDEAGRLRNDITDLLALKACVDRKEFDRGRAIIAAMKLEDGPRPMELINSIIDFYGESGDLEAAQRVFEGVAASKRDIITIHTMMNAFCANQREADCIAMFKAVFMSDGDGDHRGDHRGDRPQIAPNHISFAIALKACIQSTALYEAEWIHSCLLKETKYEAMGRSVDVQVNLICVFGKCSKLKVCREIFEGIKKRENGKYRTEIMLWNAMMNAFGRNGELHDTLGVLQEMGRETVLSPNDRTLCILLNACSHCGDIDTARSLWNEHVAGDVVMKRDISVNTAFVDCLSRKGLVRDAHCHLLEYEEFVGGEEDTYFAWMSVLNGCKINNEVEFGKEIFPDFERRFGHRPECATNASILMSNLVLSQQLDSTDGQTAITNMLPLVSTQTVFQ